MTDTVPVADPVDRIGHGVLRTELGLGTFEARLGAARAPAAPGTTFFDTDRLRRAPLVSAPARPRSALPARPPSGQAARAGRRRDLPPPAARHRARSGCGRRPDAARGATTIGSGNARRVYGLE